MYDKSGDDGAVFFVIHDNSLGPYTHHFKTDTMINYVHTGKYALIFLPDYKANCICF